MNTNTAGDRGRADAYATLAFGTRARGGADWSTILDVNVRDKTGYGAMPGKPVDALVSEGIKLGVFSASTQDREASLLVTESDGETGDAVHRYESFRSCVAALEQWILSSKTHGMGVVELGRGSQAALLRRLEAIASLVVDLRETNQQVALAFISPGPLDTALYGERMTPLLFSPSPRESGESSTDEVANTGDYPRRRDMVLASLTTRRVGIVLNTDFMPTVMAYFGVSSTGTGVTGHPLTSVVPNSAKGIPNSEWSLKQYKGIINRTHLNFLFLPIFVGWLILSLVALAAVYCANQSLFSLPSWFISPVATAGTFVSSLWPVAFMVAALFPPTSIGIYVIAISALIGTAVYFANRAAEAPMKASAITAAVVCIVIITDLLSRGILSSRAVMSYDVQGGTRFYGLGNEYMGLLIGAYIAFSAYARELWSTSIKELSIGAAVVTIGIGAPFAGANYIGVLVSAIGLGSALILISGRSIRLVGLLALAAMGLLGIAVMSVLDSVTSRASTHLAQATKLVGDENFSEVFRLINRKLAMSWRVIAYTPWTVVFLVILVVILISGSKKVRASQSSFARMMAAPWVQLEAKHQPIAGGLRGACIAAIAAFLLEDSGVVTGALAMLVPFYSVGFLYLVSSWKKSLS